MAQRGTIGWRRYRTCACNGSSAGAEVMPHRPGDPRPRGTRRLRSRPRPGAGRGSKPCHAAEVRTMLDLHCHILPGVDDGAASLEEALAMARFCVRDGITHLVATPHCHRHLRLLRADILPHVARFNEELARAQVPLTVLA